MYKVKQPLFFSVIHLGMQILILILQIIYVGWAPFLHNVLCSKVPMSGCVCSSFFIGMWPKVEKSSIRPRKTGRGKSLKSQMTNGTPHIIVY